MSEIKLIFQLISVIYQVDGGQYLHKTPSLSVRGERVAPGLPVCREVVVQRAGAGEGGVAGAGDEDREAGGSRHPGPGTEADLSLST